jgi:hypothetical protein
MGFIGLVECGVHSAYDHGMAFGGGNDMSIGVCLRAQGTIPDRFVYPPSFNTVALFHFLDLNHFACNLEPSPEVFKIVDYILTIPSL